MKRLSRPLEALRSGYCVVVVGSGYGGSIAACRLAQAGVSVCVLERGREMLPGDFPDGRWGGVQDIQAVSKAGRHVGSPTALFDFRLDDDINVLVGCGLGGTSLINANVALRPGGYVFDHRWPHELRGANHRDLDDGYGRANDMLRPVPFPESLKPPAKLAALQSAAERTNQGDYFTRPPITVTFNDGRNHVGVEQRACVQCGDCCSGCNFAAKNTTLMNYLPEAAAHGAEIFSKVDVRTVHFESGRWIVRYRRADDAGPDGTATTAAFVIADVVVLAAGTLGSTEILMRSKKECGLAISDRLGHRFSGNGDVIGFAYDTDIAVNGVGRGRHQTVADPHVGPTITGMVDRRDRETLADRIIVQDASIPSLLGRLLPAAFFATATAEKGDGGGARTSLARAWREIESVPFGPYEGPISRSATYLVMSSDDAHGRIRMRRDRAGVDWPGVGMRPVFTRDNSDLGALASSLGGTYLSDPLWFRHRDLITVHPLGGCVMADRAETGVVNHKGQVFFGPVGDDVHHGLYVMDGSIVPSPIGVNPFLTIAALAERGVDLLAKDRGWAPSDQTSGTPGPAGPPSPPSPPLPSGPPSPPPDAPTDDLAAQPGIRFRETLRGFMSYEGDSYDAAYRRGRVDATSFEYHLTIASDDLPAMLARPSHPAAVSGTVTAPGLSPQPLQVHGTFQLFALDASSVETTRMWYWLALTAEDAKVYDFVGHKLIRGQGARDMWTDTTTLFFTLAERCAGAPVARGILRVSPVAFARVLRTIEITNTPDAVDRARYLQCFVRVFLRVLWHTYAGILDLEYDFLPPPEPLPPARHLRAPPPECHRVELRDGVSVILTRHHGGPKGPVLLAPGFGVTADSFATVTVDENLVECLTEHQYDVWLFDYRASPRLVSDEEPCSADFSIDDIAVFDWPGAVDYVRRVTDAESVQVVAHCVGSMSFLMAMTLGLDGVRSAVCSQLTVDAPTNPMSHLKASLRVADVFQGIGLRVLNTDAPPSALNKTLDAVLHLNPVLRGQRCHNPVCRRIYGIFGPSYNHEQLNEGTHRAIHAWFGNSSDIAFKQLATIVRRKVAVDRDGRNRYLPRLNRVRIPIHFLAGDENEEFYPCASALTMRRLQQVNNPNLYTRTVLPGYGHMDCFIGRDAAADVFPDIVKHLDAHPALAPQGDPPAG